MKYQRPRGTEDILPDRSWLWRKLENEFFALTALYGYGEIRTPTFEDYDLFVRTSGEERQEKQAEGHFSVLFPGISTAILAYSPARFPLSAPRVSSPRARLPPFRRK